jgi:hypothetical protein
MAAARIVAVAVASPALAAVMAAAAVGERSGCSEVG